jgi:predicted alpha-1,6-mannanase (GH76 family)
VRLSASPGQTVAGKENAVSWSVWAEQAHGLLVGRFWHARRGLFRIHATHRSLWPARWHYWWQAHALDALVDAVDRRDQAAAEIRERIQTLLHGVRRRNGGRIDNDYYDDMAWMALALLRAEESAGVGTIGLVRELAAQIRRGWDERHGGVVWRRGDTYTNTPANAPVAVLAARLYQRDRDPTDLDWALRINDWLHETLVDGPTGLVWDGVHPETDPGPSRELYTYNQGTVVGASVELHRVTGEAEHLRRAVRTAAATLDRFVRPADGMLPDEGDADGGLFKGILARYLGELVREANGSDLSEDAGSVIDRVTEMLRHNAVALVSAGGMGPVGPDWARPAEGGGSLSTHLSAVLLLETLARLEASGAGGERLRAPP